MDQHSRLYYPPWEGYDFLFVEIEYKQCDREEEGISWEAWLIPQGGNGRGKETWLSPQGGTWGVRATPEQGSICPFPWGEQSYQLPPRQKRVNMTTIARQHNNQETLINKNHHLEAFC